MSTDHRPGTLREPQPLAPPAAHDLATRLHAQVAAAAALARRAGHPVLLSVGEASAVDPLAAIGATERPGATPALAALVATGRMFWAHERDDVAIAGIGAAAVMTPTGPGRFATCDARWRDLLASALIDDGGLGAAEAGPLLMGGFSFEPNGPRWEQWRDFPAAHLMVPALQLSSHAGRGRLELNTMVAGDGEAHPPVVDLLEMRAWLHAAALQAATTRPSSTGLAWAPLRDPEDWRRTVGDAVHDIEGGTLQKVVLARAIRATLAGPLDIAPMLALLRATHRDSYVFAWWRGANVFAGASPERLVRLRGADVDASSLAGSAPRGATPAEDAAYADALTRSAKDLAEHAMVRSALGTALAGLCDDIVSPDGPSLLTLPHVHHLHTAVRARLRPGHSLLDLAGALHPTPAVGGTPREPALAFIRAREQLDRGWYAAPIGWIGRDGGELAVALRSALISPHAATLFAGCGIVAGSEPARELEESEMKLRPMSMALDGAAAGGPAAA